RVVPGLGRHVLVVGELEPHRGGVEHGQRVAVLLPTRRHDVVAAPEATAGIPVRDLLGIRLRASAEHGDDRRPRVSREQLAATEHCVVEVRRDDDQAAQLLGDRSREVAHGVCHLSTVATGLRSPACVEHSPSSWPPAWSPARSSCATASTSATRGSERCSGSYASPSSRMCATVWPVPTTSVSTSWWSTRARPPTA